MKINIELKIETLEMMRKTFKQKPHSKITFEHPEFSLNFYLNDHLTEEFCLSYDDSDTLRFKNKQN